MSESPRPNLLVIEDDPNIRRLLESVLAEPYDLTFTDEVEEGLGLFSRDGPDLVLTDLSLPEGVEGLEIVRGVRDLEGHTAERTPVVIVTARTDTETIVEGFDAGADDYVTKPFRPPELLARIGVHLENRRLATQLGKEQARVERLGTAVRMAGAVAHEINNPLSGIIGYCDLIRHELAEEEPDLESLRQDVKRIRAQGNRIAKVVRRLTDLKDVSFRSYVGEDEIVDLSVDLEKKLALGEGEGQGKGQAGRMAAGAGPPTDEPDSGPENGEIGDSGHGGTIGDPDDGSLGGSPS